MLKNIRNFNSEEVAKAEYNAWKAYYEHRFFSLFFILTKFLRNFFGFGFWKSLQVGFYCAYPAIIFRINKGKENDKIKSRILDNLKKFYKLVNDNSIEKFDYEKTAKLEMEWWFVDRYPKDYEISRETAIARTMAEMYKVPPNSLIDFAKLRSEAMVLQDKKEMGIVDNTDWEKIFSLLKDSYSSLWQVLNQR